MNHVSKNFWENTKQVSQFYKLETSERVIIQEPIAEIINKLNPINILDYGCGDGYVHTRTNLNINKHLFDINSGSLSNVIKSLKEFNCIAIYDDKDILNNYYDCIILSLVLVCVKDLVEQKEILRKLHKYKTSNGKLIFASSHPCFRQYSYRSYYTSINEESFQYMNEGFPFEVFMKEDEEVVSFTDYHTSMSFIVNSLIEAGFTIEKMVEISDKPLGKDKYYNNLFPPFFILICH